MAKADGMIFEYKDTSEIDGNLLETFEFRDVEQLIHIENDEFSAVCPFSGLPDIGKLTIDYKPQGECCLELKSFKYYLTTFRNVGIYQEAVTKRIYDDLKWKLDTDSLSVILDYNIRGGMRVITAKGKI